MGNPSTTIAAAVGVFVGTNIDDIVVLAVLFLSSRAGGKPRPWQIWAGQYIGISALVVISAAGALGLAIVPDRWVGLLGLLPLTLGVWGLVKVLRDSKANRDRPHDEQPRTTTGLASVIAVTLANGADNIAAYTPIFRTSGVGASVVTVAVFGVLVAVWCKTGSWIGSHPKAIAVITRYGHWVVPGVLTLIGGVILFRFCRS